MTQRESQEAGRFPPLWVREPMPHLGHGMHLCHLVEWEGINMKDYKPLVRNAKFLCKKCGRVAAKEENLCDPIEL